MHVLIKNKRIKFANEIFRFFEEEVNQYFKVTNISIIFSKHVSEHLLNNIIKTLQNVLCRTIKVNYVKDNSLLGGIQIKIGNYLLDDSIKNKLFKLKNSLVNINIL